MDFLKFLNGDFYHYCNFHYAISDGATNATCIWRDPINGMRNSGNEAATYRDISLEDCKMLLEKDAPTFKSLEYHKASRICYLQKVDRFSHRLTVNDANYVYQEYSCLREYRVYVVIY